MGTLSYDSSYKAEFDDRVLAHLQIVIGAKLRRGESFHFSWRNEQVTGQGRTTIWLHPTVPLIYSYLGSRTPTINRLWIEALMTSANSVAGLQIVPEPSESTPLATDDEALPAPVSLPGAKAAKTSA
ncbi:MAG: ATP-dependent ligase [Microbacteriaceae bacterium]|nr:ATP-dependent ligase [Microbacteriaceae bacterium]